MKKSLIALAVLATAGAASAQSSVQLYGIADVWFGSTSVKDGAGNKIYDLDINGVKTSQTQISSGGVDTSRWGLKGSEDLGGGLKANFQLEQGISVDSGATKGNGFDRIATVGLSGNFGAVTLGKQYTAYDDVQENGFATFKSQHLASQRYAYFSQNANLIPVLTAGAIDIAPYQANPANTIKYQSNTYGGFSAAASYSLGEDKNMPAMGDASNVIALSGQYASGPLAVALGHQQEKFQADAQDKSKFTTLNGSYDLGSFKLLGDYTHSKFDDANKSNDWSIGAQVPLASNLLLSGGYSAGKLKADGDTLAKSKGLSAALAYVLSKRTLAYAGFNATNVEEGNGDDMLKVRAYAVGVKHNF